MSLHREREHELGYPELVAIALGGMVGGGIFTILGISVELVGNLTPVAIIIGGLLASLAAYSYVKLGLYYKDEGATYSFFKKSFDGSHTASSVIGWYVLFGYISTMALYAYTFSSYAISSFEFGNDPWVRKGVAAGIIILFTLVNVWSVNGMGKLEDLMVYTKLVILFAISGVLIWKADTPFVSFLHNMAEDTKSAGILNIFIVASVTFVAYEGFQLVLNAVNEMKDPDKNIPRAIYTAIGLAILIYVVLATAALLAIPAAKIIANKEYALASGASEAIGKIGHALVIIGAVLATSSAISGTLFGSSRQMAVVATDGYMPAILGKRKRKIPVNAIICLAVCAIALIFSGGLELILEFGSITFLLVSLLMALANFKKRKETQSAGWFTIIALVGLAAGTVLIFYYEIKHKPEQMLFIGGMYVVLTLVAWLYARYHDKHANA